MTIYRIDPGGVVVEDLAAAIAFSSLGWRDAGRDGGLQVRDAARRGEPRVAGMRTHDYLKARLLYVRQDFDAALEKLTDADLPWRPANDMPSIAGLLIEIANKEKELIAWLQRGEWPDDDPDAFDERATLAEMRLVLATLREQTLRYVDSFDEAGLEELVRCPERWWEALRLEACPRSEILRNLAAHEWYHTGQLIVYQSMRGLNPDDN